MATSDQILRNTTATLQVQFFTNGALVDPDDQTATVTLYRPDGSVFIATTAATRTGVGTFTYMLAPQANLIKLKLDWTGTFNSQSQTITTRAEVVGAYLFTVSEARNFGFLKKLSDATKYPTALITEAREEVTEQLERYCRVSFVPRYRRIVMDGPNNSCTLYVPNFKVTKILSASINGFTIDPADIELYPDSYGELHYEGGWGDEKRSIVLEYEHGYEAPPGRLVRAVLVYLESILIGTDITSRSTTMTNETGTYRLSYPDFERDRPTGIPMVDTIFTEYIETLVVL